MAPPQLIFSFQQGAAGRFRVAESANDVTGFMVLFVNGVIACVEHLWVRVRRMRQDVGKALFPHALEQARVERCTILRVVSNPHARPFYEATGCTVVGEAPFTPGRRFLPILEKSISANWHFMQDDVTFRIGLNPDI